MKKRDNLRKRMGKLRCEILEAGGGPPSWGSITGKPSVFPPESHTHSGYEPSNANIQAHIGSTHAPSNAQKNSDITLAEIEAKLTGEISSHTHAPTAAVVDVKQTEVDFGTVPIKMKRFTITDSGVSPSNQILAALSYDDPSDGDVDSAEWFENLTVMAKAGTGQFFLYCSSIFADINGKVKINYIIGSLVFVALQYITFLCLLKDT